MSEDLERRASDLYLDPADQITEENTYTDSETNTTAFEDQAAVKLVIDDTHTVDNWLNITQWAAGWTLADTLYQSPQSSSSFDGGSNVAQANVPKYMVSNHISSVVPKLMGGIFYEDPPFVLRPSPSTPQVITRAKSSLFTFQLWDMKFEEETERVLDQMALFGTGIMKWGYLEYTKREKRYVRREEQKTIEAIAGPPIKINTTEADAFDIKYVDTLVSRPWIKCCDIRTVLVDPGCRTGDIRDAKWLIYRDYANYTDLTLMRDIPGYSIPDEDVLKNIFMKGVTSPPDNIALTIPEGMYGYLQHALPRSHKTGADPLKSPMEILERWDNERVVVILHFNGHNVLIRNEANPYGKIPFLSANWRNIPDCFYGQGLGVLLGSEQLVEQGVTNLALDLLAYGLQPTALRKKGFNTPTQNIRWGQGRIIDVDDDVDKAFKFLQMPNVPGEAWAFIQQAQSAGASNSGANEQVVQGVGSAGIKTTGMRSGTGAAAVIQANASRLDGPDGRFIRQIFIPWLYVMDELNNDLLPASVLRQVLGDSLGEDAPEAKIDHISFREAKYEYEVLAGTHLGAKKEMSQFLPILLQIFNSPSFTKNLSDGGHKWDAIAIFKAFCDAAGWRFSQNFVVPLTAQEKQQQIENSPAAMQQRQMQAQQAIQNQKFQQERQLEDERQLGKAGGEVLRSSMEKALASEGGVPPTTGFGSETRL